MCKNLSSGEGGPFSCIRRLTLLNHGKPKRMPDYPNDDLRDHQSEAGDAQGCEFLCGEGRTGECEILHD